MVGGSVEKIAMAQDVRTFHDLVVPVESEQRHRVSSVNLMLQYRGKTIEQIKEPWKPS